MRRPQATGRAEAAAVREAAERPVVVPTEADARAAVDGLAEPLLAAAARGDPEAAGLVRALVEALTGGRIELYQMGDPTAKHGWLQGRFRLRAVRVAAGQPLGRYPDRPDEGGPEVCIDYRRTRVPPDDEVGRWRSTRRVCSRRRSAGGWGCRGSR